MAASVKILFVMELGLGPGDFVLDGNLVPLPKKGAEPPPQFSAHFYCGQMTGYIKMPFTIDVRLSAGDFVLDGDSVPPPQKGEESPNFRPMFIVAKWLDGLRCHLART